MQTAAACESLLQSCHTLTQPTKQFNTCTLLQCTPRNLETFLHILQPSRPPSRRPPSCPACVRPPPHRPHTPVTGTNFSLQYLSVAVAACTESGRKRAKERERRKESSPSPPKRTPTLNPSIHQSSPPYLPPCFTYRYRTHKTHPFALFDLFFLFAPHITLHTPPNCILTSTHPFTKPSHPHYTVWSVQYVKVLV